MTADPRDDHAACEQAIADLNDQIDALKRKYSLLVRTAEGLRFYQNELDAMRLRGEPVQTGLALAAKAVITALDA